MRRAWVWLTDHLPERLLMAFDVVPFVVARRSTLDARERNGFELGRDYERGLTSERDAALGERLDRVTAGLSKYADEREQAGA